MAVTIFLYVGWGISTIIALVSYHSNSIISKFRFQYVTLFFFETANPFVIGLKETCSLTTLNGNFVFDFSILESLDYLCKSYVLRLSGNSENILRMLRQFLKGLDGRWRVSHNMYVAPYIIIHFTTVLVMNLPNEKK